MLHPGEFIPYNGPPYMQYNYKFYLQPPAPERVRKRKREGGQKGASASAPAPASDDTEDPGAPTPADLPDNLLKAVPLTAIKKEPGLEVLGHQMDAVSVYILFLQGSPSPQSLYWNWVVVTVGRPNKLSYMYVLYFQADEAPTTQTGPVATPSADPVESAVPEEDEIVGENQGGDQAEEDPVNPDVIEISDSSQPLTTEGATAAADIVNQGEQVGRGPQGPSGGLAPEVVAACTRAHLVNLGVAPPTSGHPPVADPAPFSFSSPRPPAAGRSPGMSLEQWEAISAPSGGGQVRPSRPGHGSLPRRAVHSSLTTAPAPPASTMPTGGAAQGAASSSGKPLSSRERKKARGFIVWYPSQDQLMHAQLLLRGASFYKMDTPICLSSSDPRMVGVPLSKKWLCAHCDMQYSSQLDCQGHTLSAHSQVRSPSLCDCRVSTFNSAKALWDHLTLQHNIDVRKLKNEDPPSPWLKSNTRTSR